MRGFGLWGLIGVLLSSGCEKLKDPDYACMLVVPMNRAMLTFDGSGLAGQQIQMKSGGNLVWDSCQGGIVLQSDGSFYQVYLDGAASAVSRSFESDALPSGESFELLSSPDCSSAFTSRGSAAVTYHFVLQPGDAKCGGEYWHDEQLIVFQ